MNHITSFLIFLLMAACLESSAQQTNTSRQQLASHTEKPSDAAGIFTIYPGNGVPPGSEDWPWKERTTPTPDGRMTRNVVVPTITMYKPPKGKAKGTALIVAPGGAFYFLMMDKEGAEVAKWLANQGITTFVLKYRVAASPENDAELQPFLTKLFEVLPRQGANEVDPPIGTKEGEAARLLSEEDGRQAIRFVRQHAKEFGIEPEKIGIMGFSAGGGIAVNVALEHDSLSCPAFAAGIYAGYRKGIPVPADAPPLFLATIDKDVLVAPVSLARLYENWHKAGKPVELHIFGSGEHGFGARKNNTLSDAWTDLFKNWLAANGFLPLK
jgi:acetyl esterase/lipase